MTTLTELVLEAEAALERFSRSGPDAAALAMFHNLAMQMHSVPPAWAADRIDAMLMHAARLFGVDALGAPGAHPDGETGPRQGLQRELIIIQNIDRRYQRTAA